MKKPIEIAARYERELFESVIPFWEKNCVDKEFGAYFTMLDRDGTVYDTEKFMWMQWRIVYMFATLYQGEKSSSKWLEIARSGAEFLLKNGKDEAGDYYFALNREGVPSMAPHSIYSNCFAAMGCAAMFQATGEEEYHSEAVAAMGRYLLRMDSPKGKWEKAMSGKRKRLNLGHFMMLANLGDVMNDCLGITDYEDDIERSAKTVLDLFWRDDLGVILENINPEGGVDLESRDGRLVNPGHGLEAMWFLLQHAEKNGDKNRIDLICEIILSLLKFGWDEEFGGIHYFCDAKGLPPGDLEADMKLWWVHNEAILAVLHALRLTGRREFREWFERLDEWVWQRFPDQEFGEWYGYLNRQGEVSNRLKGGQWKTFFHLPRFLLLGTEHLKAISKRLI